MTGPGPNPLPDDPPEADFVFTRRGRTPAIVLILAAVCCALLAAWRWLDAAPWVLALLALPTLPALWDLWTDPVSELRLTRGRIRWRTGRREGSLPLVGIDRIRLDTRWDLSARATVIGRDGSRQRLPDAALPPRTVLDAALTARGITVERHHFTVF